MKYSRRSLIRSHLDAQILDTDYFLRLIELTVIYSKYAKSILKIRMKFFSRVTDWQESMIKHNLFAKTEKNVIYI
jgi:hypothetical protein